MENLSVLLTTYPEAFLHKGGGEYELLETALNLRKLGFIADAYSPYSNSLDNYANIIHFSINPSGLPLLQAVKAAGKRVVLWPNFWTTEPNHNSYPYISSFLNLSDLVVFKSNIEKINFEKIEPLDNIETIIVPTSVDKIFTDITPPSLFRESFGIDKYLVWVGIIEPKKNQLTAIQALSSLDVPIVFIGNYRDKSYYEACKNAASSKCLFLGPMEHKSDLLRAAIRESALYIEPSLEPAGKSILEAAICGARLLVSDNPWEHEHLGKFAIYVDPTDQESLRQGVQQGLVTSPPVSQAKVISEKHLFPKAIAHLTAYLVSVQ